MARWVIFGALVALVPFGVEYLALRLNRAPASLGEILKHGELLLLTTALCAGAIGELIGSGRTAAVRKILAGGGATLSMIVAVLYFSHVAVANATGSTVDLDAIVFTSVSLYLLAFISSGCCIILSEV